MTPRTNSRSAKTLERIHMLRTLVNYGPMTGLDLADRANTECDHERLEGLGEISRRGIGQKLQAMSLAGLVTGYLPSPLPKRLSDRTTVWEITEKGRVLATSIGPVPEPDRTSILFDDAEIRAVILALRFHGPDEDRAAVMSALAKLEAEDNRRYDESDGHA